MKDKKLVKALVDACEEGLAHLEVVREKDEERHGKHLASVWNDRPIAVLREAIARGRAELA